MKKSFDKIKPYAVGFLVILAIAVGTWQMLKEQVERVGDLGMNDIGRQILCQTFDAEFRDARGDSHIRVYCEGFFKDVVVFSMKDAMPILVGSIKPDDVVSQMKQPYKVALKGLTGLVLQGDKYMKTIDKPVPIGEILSRLEELGVETVADFWASCGFTKFIIRDEQENVHYLDITFSNKRYGSNPVEVK